MVQATVPDQLQEDVYVHGFWKWGISDLFYMQIVNLYEVFYLHQTSSKFLVTADKDKKDK